MPSKYEIMRELIAKETSWSNGADCPWEGDGIVGNWFLDRLAFLAGNAPHELIMDLINACELGATDAQKS